MSANFDKYAAYYDLIYNDKEYPAEARFLDGLLTAGGRKPGRLLELGCGTGAHAISLARMGYHVTGVDLSRHMIDRANQKLCELEPAIRDRVQVSEGDIRALSLNREFDAVFSLFHVMSYQVTNQDLTRAFASAARHLKPGGVFAFDCWYGPAVLSDRPQTRVKYLENDVIKAVRIAEPVLLENQNRVDVNYRVLVTDKKSNVCSELFETHRMRYLFWPEIEALFQAQGLRLLSAGKWMSEQQPSDKSWYVHFVGIK